VETNGIPVIAIAGTCMNAGKTAAACAIVSRIRHHGHTVDAFKATGVSLRRDILAMEDAGARNTLIFTDFGVVSTTAANGPAVTRTMLTRLAAQKPD
jgi:molybdopterin-guanine dinucleotide biosynthesis protein